MRAALRVVLFCVWLALVERQESGLVPIRFILGIAESMCGQNPSLELRSHALPDQVLELQKNSWLPRCDGGVRVSLLADMPGRCEAALGPCESAGTAHTMHSHHDSRASVLEPQRSIKHQNVKEDTIGGHREVRSLDGCRRTTLFQPPRLDPSHARYSSPSTTPKCDARSFGARMVVLHCMTALALVASACGDTAADLNEPLASPVGITTGGTPTPVAPVVPAQPSVSPTVPAPVSASWEAGNTYLLTIPTDNWTDPRDVGPEIGAYVPQFILQVDARTGDTAALTIGTAYDAVQDLCSPTASTQTTAAPYPGVQIGPFDFPMRLVKTDDLGAVEAIVHATAYQLTLTNLMPMDGDPDDGMLTVTMDIREIYPMFTELATDPTAEVVCNALGGAFGAPCEPCPADQQPWCLPLIARLLEATPAPATLALQPVPTTISTVEGCMATPTDEETPAPAPTASGTTPAPSATAPAAAPTASTGGTETPAEAPAPTTPAAPASTLPAE